MEKITRIHLSRVPYEIGIQAETKLKKYLNDIGNQLESDSADEIMADIEVRITEILYERGVKTNDVITAKDVNAIQKQLGMPEQFNVDLADYQTSDRPDSIKKLLRDPESGYIGGVASGLGAYFRIDPIFIRLLFIVLVFVSGLGLGIYALLWLLVPAAKSSSDKLLMRGKPVTATNLQHYRETAGMTLANPVVKYLVGLCWLLIKWLLTFGAALFTLLILSAIGFGSAILYTKPLRALYVAYHLDYLMVALIWLLTMILVGFAIILMLYLWRARSRSIRLAFTTLSVLLVLTLAGSAVVTPFVVSHYKNIFGANNQFVTLPVLNASPLIKATSLNLNGGDDLAVSYTVSNQALHANYQSYPGMLQPNILVINKNGVISVHSKNLTQVAPKCVLDWCHSIYLPVKVNIYGPNLTQVTSNGSNQLNVSDLNQSNLVIIATNGSTLTISNSYSSDISLYATGGSNIDASDETSQVASLTSDDTSYIFGPASNNVKLSLPSGCNGPLVEFSQTPSMAILNGQTMTSNALNQDSCVNLDNASPYVSSQSGPANGNVPSPQAPFAP